MQSLQAPEPIHPDDQLNILIAQTEYEQCPVLRLVPEFDTVKVTPEVQQKIDYYLTDVRTF